MNKILLAALGAIILVSSCEWLEENTDLSEDDIVEGLKTALTVGTDSSSTALSLVNGYYGDALVKIPLPDEAEAVRTTINSYSTLADISSTIGLDDMFDDVILSVNRAAEDAASEAAPIFKTAITDLSILQGLEILNGQVPDTSSTAVAVALKSSDFDSTAATQYLSLKTYSSLTNAFAPKINTSLKKDLVGNISAVNAWETLTSAYNNFLNRNDVKAAIVAANFLGQSIDLPDAINSDLAEFSTQKALDGLFLKVGDVEKRIRKNPYEWALDILHKVFG